ncbi:hypothetical protein G5B37_04795 [Rasiella rasia]|uniref:C1q domain-containing protein n=1 Tax=Rasiella rasia TaxID=2744027 RepID=A0A6G6GKG4_9FLAO|nr:hypothetical protein [Rasiella rasia]QIE58903.1 hypothetical protein G5B37_04795 [Rasiella rasia]
MKTTLFVMLVGSCMFAQVGIGTTSPIATLDINGTINIRTIPHASNLDITKDVVLTSENGLVSSMTASEIVDKAIPTAVKGSFSVATPITISLLSGSDIIPFDSEDFDTMNEFDTTTHEFTVQRDGIYEITVQIGMDATIGAATNLGVRILKNGTVVHKHSHANVNVIGINVTSPIRKLDTLLSLNTNDVITFEIEGDIALGSIDLTGDSLTSYFTIQQIK